MPTFRCACKRGKVERREVSLRDTTNYPTLLFLPLLSFLSSRTQACASTPWENLRKFVKGACARCLDAQRRGTHARCQGARKLAQGLTSVCMVASTAGRGGGGKVSSRRVRGHADNKGSVGHHFEYSECLLYTTNALSLSLSLYMITTSCEAVATRPAWLIASTMTCSVWPGCAASLGKTALGASLLCHCSTSTAPGNEPTLTEYTSV